ncbi:MAG: glycosyltransferase family 4 protein [Ruminococcus sp.]|nr:glycosyltransferase family 4 protein [Ruminococcus sp.]
MKKVYLNGFLLASKELYGVQRFTYELLRELDKYADKDLLEVLVPDTCEREFGFKNIGVTKVPGKLDSKGRSRFWNHFGFKNYVRKCGGLSMDTMLTYPFTGCDIFTYHDCILEKVPQNFRTPKEKLVRIRNRLLVNLNLRRAKVVLTISRNSKSDILGLYGIPSKKIAIIYTGWQHFERIEPDGTVLARLGLIKGEYCFSLGSRYYHKNFRWVVEAARQNPQYTFVVTGSDIISTTDSYLNKIKPRNLIFTGYLSDSEIKALMANCKVFIQPSLYEGAGMPPMEAMSAGARCIVSNRTSLPELYGESVWYIDPEQYDGIDIDSIMTGSIASNKEVLDRFSWDRSARRLYKVIRDVRRRCR